MNKIFTDKVIIWCGSGAVAIASAVVFLFTTFQTSAASDKTVAFINARLDRIETKIDQLLEANK
jgi:hypothetical protein